MGFLEKVYLGNTLQNWLVALCIMVVAFAYPTSAVYVQNHFEGEK
jgi:hypothetical protein